MYQLLRWCIIIIVIIIIIRCDYSNVDLSYVKEILTYVEVISTQKT